MLSMQVVMGARVIDMSSSRHWWVDYGGDGCIIDADGRVVDIVGGHPWGAHIVKAAGGD